MYNDLVQPLVPWAWGGGVSTLFAYGQTGSGKTYTVNELERLAAEQLMNGGLDGNRDIFLCMFELADNAAFGTSPSVPSKESLWGLDEY